MAITDDRRADMATDVLSALVSFRGPDGGTGPAALVADACDLADLLAAELERRSAAREAPKPDPLPYKTPFTQGE